MKCIYCGEEFELKYTRGNALKRKNCYKEECEKRRKKENQDRFKAKMKEILAQIQDGSYAKEFMDEFSSGGGKFKELRKASEGHLIEKVGAEIRSSFNWNRQNKLIDKSKN